MLVAPLLHRRRAADPRKASAPASLGLITRLPVASGEATGFRAVDRDCRLGAASKRLNRGRAHYRCGRNPSVLGGRERTTAFA